MKKIAIGGLILLFALFLYLGFTLFFTWLFREVATSQISTATPAPTFTPVPVNTAPLLALVTPETATPIPTTTPIPSPTSTPLPPATPTDLPTASPTNTMVPAQAQVVSSATVNVRSGPGTNYPVLTALPPGVPVPVVGRNEGSSWWQIQGADGSTGWVADSVVQATNVGSVPVVAAPPPPQQPPTPTSPPPPPAKPQYQYEPTGWFADTNFGLTRFLGNISDVNGNPVDGVFVEAQCGSFRVISNPSGPVGWGPFNESHTWPPGFYDITLDTRPIVCSWTLAIVETSDKENVTAYLSEKVKVDTTTEESIVTANWRKNW
jgi:uncharacterized protein YgiM (DUF1202 family)